MKFLEKIPLLPLLLAAIFMSLAPFSPQPHLWEKLNMLFGGVLVKPIDIFDLFLHSFLLVLVVIKLMSRFGRTKGSSAD